MKAFLKILSIFTISLIILSYIFFLVVLPHIFNLNKFKPEIQEFVQKQGNVKLNLQNLKLITKPNLQVGFETGNVSLVLPDNSTIFNANNINLRVSLAQMLLLKINIFGEIQEPTLNLDIVNGKQFSVISHIEKLLNKNKEEYLIIQDAAETSKPASLPINPDLIRYFANIKLNNYKVIINDIKTSHNLKLQGDDLYLGFYNNKFLNLKTNFKLFSDETNMINANLNIDTFLPEFESENDEEDKAIEVKLPFVNPVLVYRNYNVKGNFNANLKIREKNNIIKTWGYFDLEKLTANLSGLQLPESYIKFKSKGSKIITDTNLFFAKNQNLKINGNFDYLNPKMDLSILSEKIYFNDVIILCKSILDTLRIKNDFDSLSGKGYFLANADIKTDFKKIKSNGTFIVSNGKIASKKSGLVLDKMNININLDNNVLKIHNSGANINGKPLVIKGQIDEKTNTDINITLNKLPLPQLYNVFAPIDIKKQFDLISGNLTLQAKIEGKLKDAIANLKINLSDFIISDISKTFILSNNYTDIEFFNNFKEGLIRNDNLKLFIPLSKSTISIPMSSVNLNRTNILIPESLIKINKNSLLIFSGDIQNYISKPSINFVSTGDIYAEDIQKLAGDEFEPFLDAKGKLPLELSFSGDDKKQLLDLKIFSNNKNYITPVYINTLINQNTVFKTVIRLRNNRIKIKDTGLYTITKTIDENGMEKISYNPALEINGTIVGNYINKINVNIPNNFNGVIYSLKNSKFNFEPSKINIYGDIDNPKFRGKVCLNNIYIPSLYTELKNLELNFKDSFLNFKLSDLILNGSGFNIEGNLSLIPDKILKVFDLNVNSKYIDTDKLIKVSDAAIKILPQTGTNNKNAEDIPVLINNGNINIKHIKSGNIILKNTTSNLHLRNNILFLNNLLTNMCKGKINGRIAINLINNFTKVELKGLSLNTEELLLQAAEIKDAVTGTTDFETNISLSGTTLEEQMKSLSGKVKFTVKDGQFGPFGRLENMILAENIRESEFFNSTIGKALEPLVTIDTTHFSTLNGNLKFKDGIVTIEPINSSGNILALNIFGTFNLLTNIADMKVRSRLASDVSDMLGPISMINPINLVKNTPGLNIVLAKSFSIFCESLTQEEIDKIPDFAKKHSDTNATKFQIILKGDVNKPFKLVKSFKWVATQDEINKAQNFANELQIQEEDEIIQNSKDKQKRGKNEKN